MEFDPNNFKQLSYGGVHLYFDSSCCFHDFFCHKLKTRKFPFYRNIISFMAENIDTKLYFTLNGNVVNFEKVDGGFLINMSAYQLFCKTIGSKTGGRLKAFLGQNLNLRQINVSDEEKEAFIKINATEKSIIDAIKNLPVETQNNILVSLNKIVIPDNFVKTQDVNSTEFISALSKFITNKEVQEAFYSNLPRIQIEILRSHLIFLKSNLDKGETFIQEWLNEENGKYKKQRCLIFGIEFIDPKKEGEFMRKRFDILAEQNLDNHVLIELKSPNADVFTVKKDTTINEGFTTEYHLSPELARAIPQVLEYKKWYENARLEEIQALGIERKRIHKCIIVIGTRKDDDVWKENFQMIKSNLMVELYTYSDLIDKLENTIKNLEDGLR